MTFICNICDNTFTQKNNLNKHLGEKRCKSSMLTDLFELNKYISELKLKNTSNIISNKNKNIHIGDNNNVNNVNNVNIK